VPPAGDIGLERRAAALAHYAAAQQLEKEGKMRDALRHYTALVELDPGNLAILQRTAELASQYQDAAGAIRILEAAIAARPQNPAPTMALVRFLATYAATDAVAMERIPRLLDGLCKAHPRNAEVLTFSILQHLAQGRREAAVKLLEQASPGSAASAEWWLALGRAAQEVWPLGQAEMREEHTRRVNFYFERALSAAESGSEGDSARLDVAQYYVLTNQLDAARKLCWDLAEKHGNLQARKILFRLFQAEGQAEEALRQLEKIVETAPMDVEQRRLLAQAYQEREEWARAVPHLEAAIQIGGGDVADYQTLGQMLLQSQLYERLIELCERTVRLFPENPIFHIHAAFALRSLQRWEKAIAAMERAAALAESGQAELVNHRFFFQFGLTLERGGRHEEAARMFEKAITLTPKDEIEDAANTMNYLGYMWLEQGVHLEKAGELIQKANELQPGNAAYVDSLGWWYYKKGDYAHAIVELERALALLKQPESEDAEIIEHLGQAYLKLGDKEKARQMFERALSLGPTDATLRSRIEHGLKETR
jgi:tetratricopeptide (TPR) repeat protein